MPVQVVMVNSSWTRQHIVEMWGVRQQLPPLPVKVGRWTLQLPRWPWRRFLGIRGAPVARVFPPCDTSDLQGLPLDRKLKRLSVVSIG